MKRCLQLVALSLVTLLAVPPVLAEEFCLAVQGSQQMDDASCCAASGQGSMGNASQSSASTTPVAQAQSCDQGCCSVSPQNTPLPGAPERATTVRTPLAFCSAAAVIVAYPELRHGYGVQSRAIALDRQVLLHVFRI
jgi:hypothetical protein